jgi:hypothetical protein
MKNQLLKISGGPNFCKQFSRLGRIRTRGTGAEAWLLEASFDAGAEVGALGWMSLTARKRLLFLHAPTEGLFRLVR